MTSVDIPLGEITAEVETYIDRVLKAVAEATLDRAERTSAFDDQSGNLRSSGKVKKSKYNKHEYIAKFSARHAWVVEHGHRVVRRKDGAVTGHVPARPFLGPARESVLLDLPAIIRKVPPPRVRVGR